LNHLHIDAFDVRVDLTAQLPWDVTPKGRESTFTRLVHAHTRLEEFPVRVAELFCGLEVAADGRPKYVNLHAHSAVSIA
jgi:hypothetical protein